MMRKEWSLCKGHKVLCKKLRKSTRHRLQNFLREIVLLPLLDYRELALI